VLNAKKLFFVPLWFRKRIQNFLVSGLLAYVCCVGFIWYTQPEDSRPIFLVMPLLWAGLYMVLAGLSRTANGLPLRNIVTFGSNERHRHLILRFRRRAIWARANARLNMGLVVACLAGMAYVFVYAGSIMQSDAAYTLQASTTRFDNALETLAAAGLDAAPAFGLTQDDMQALAQYRVAMQQAAPEGEAAAPAAEGEEAENIARILARLDAFLASRESLGQVESTVEQLKTDAAAVRGVVEQGGAPMGGAQFVAVQGARFGSAGVLLLIILILAQLYRYNIRLAAHYDARADVIELVHSDDIEKLTKAVEFFSPDALDFAPRRTAAPAPVSPIGNALKPSGSVTEG
jgi:hypothetical protein